MQMTIENIKRAASIMPGNTIIYLVKDGLHRIFYSKGVPALSGFTEKEFQQQEKKDAFSLLVESDRAIATEQVQKCIEHEEEVNLIYRLIHKTKGMVWVHAKALVIGEMDGYPVLLTNIATIEQETEPYKMLLESSNRGVFVCDCDTNEVLYVNQTLLEMTGQQDIQFIGTHCADMMQGIIGCSAHNCVCTKCAKDKKELCYHNSLNDREYTIESKEVMWGCHRAMGVFIADVTEQRKRDKAASSAAQEHLNIIMQMNPNAFSTFRLNLTQNTCGSGSSKYQNLLTLQSKGTVDGYVENALQYVPYEREKEQFRTTFCAEKLLQTFYSGQPQVVMKHHYMLTDEQECVLMTSVNMAQNKVTGDVEGIIYTLNITEQERADHIIQLVLNEEYEGMAILNVKKRTYSLLRFELDAAVVPHSVDLCYQDGVERLIQRFVYPSEKETYRKAVDMDHIVAELNAHGTYSFTTLYRGADGKKQFKKIFYYYADEYHNEIFSVTEDITEVTQKEQAHVEALNAALLRAEQAADAKGTFLSNVSHDMRTPLNGVIGFTQLAIEAKTMEEKNEFLKKIDSSGQFLLQLINDTLDLSKIDSNSMVLLPDIYDTKEILDGVVAAVEQTAQEKNIRFNCNFEKAHFQNIRVDKLRLQQILVNLLSNAVKFTQEGGQVDFILEDIPHCDHANCKITIQDNGCGMSKEFLPKAFEAFSQQENTAKVNVGTGLGLAIVKRLVEMMNGRIELTSEEGKGTKFVIQLKLERTEESRKPPLTADYTAVLKGKNILLCEDHPINRELAVRLLDKQGMTVICAENGQEGVQTFADSAEGSFDAVLMDVRMPIMDGLTATRHIRAMQRTDAKCVPIIAMTGNAFDHDVQECLDAGMNAHISKPVEPAVLYGTLAQQIEL